MVNSHCSRSPIAMQRDEEAISGLGFHKFIFPLDVGPPIGSFCFCSKLQPPRYYSMNKTKMK